MMPLSSPTCAGRLPKLVAFAMLCMRSWRRSRRGPSVLQRILTRVWSAGAPRKGSRSSGAQPSSRHWPPVNHASPRTRAPSIARSRAWLPQMKKSSRCGAAWLLLSMSAGCGRSARTKSSVPHASKAMKRLTRSAGLDDGAPHSSRQCERRPSKRPAKRRHFERNWPNPSPCYKRWPLGSSAPPMRARRSLSSGSARGGGAQRGSRQPLRTLPMRPLRPRRSMARSPNGGDMRLSLTAKLRSCAQSSRILRLRWPAWRAARLRHGMNSRIG
mmetsp:Transcript_31477/g.92087  ORF Transcript_31477/g.92087 Transcript_31477/m.92087 type:complete len:271 (+) Transcript_31477:532-1344(+)